MSATATEPDATATAAAASNATRLAPERLTCVRVRGAVTGWFLYALGGALALYVAIVLAFVVAGRRGDARALAGFVPDCAVLFGRLLRDPRVPRRSKALVAALLPYLALPFDLIPDFIPVVGQLDDALLVAFVLRRVVRTTEPELLRELWPGPDSSLQTLLRLVNR
jgi:uncharacterized membrane protein YkvA (DUF1232 family)